MESRKARHVNYSRSSFFCLLFCNLGVVFNKLCFFVCPNHQLLCYHLLPSADILMIIFLENYENHLDKMSCHLAKRECFFPDQTYYDVVNLNHFIQIFTLCLQTVCPFL